MRGEYLLLLGCIAFLQLRGELARGAAGEGEESIDPFELARQLRSEICAMNRTQIQEFYKAQRDEENRDWQFPAVGPTTQEQTKVQRGSPVSWTWSAVVRILQPYLGRRLNNATRELFTWCVFPLSTTMDIYGCINSTDRWGSPGFRALGLLDIMSLSDHATAHKKGRLEIDTGSGSIHLSVLKGALVSCTISVPNGSTIGIYLNLDLVLEIRGSTFIRMSPQTDAFLVEGQQKNFTCQSVGNQAGIHRWYQKTEGEQYDYICNNIAGSCNSSSSYQLLIKKPETPGCAFAIADGFRYQLVDSILVIDSPTVNDTGELVCHSDYPADGRGHSRYIAVVFTKLPPKVVDIKKGSSSLLTCEMKAPSDSMVFWTLKQFHNEECQIPTLDDHEASPNDTDSIPHCNTTAVVSKTLKEVDKNYSIFRLELQIPEVNFEHRGTYSCNVKYEVGSLTEPQLIQQESSIAVVDQDQERKEGGLSKAQVTVAVMGSFILCFLIGAVVTASLILWVRNVKRSKLRGQKIARLSKGHLSIKYNEVSLVSPGVVKFEFPRRNLELQGIIGEGRFGKVYKGKAYGIVPDSPDLNTVAVKTTATDQLHVSTLQLLSELDILTNIHPHENICNLLASCTSPDGPLYVILEYAYHGNLKNYLEMCRETLLQRSVPVCIVSEEERSHFLQLLITCDSESSVASSPSQITDVIQFSVPNPDSHDPVSEFRYDHLSPADQESPCAVDKDREAMIWSTGYDRLLSKEDSNFGDSTLDSIVCGGAAFNCLITELNVRDFAHQIASGLEHLENMNIVHCDLAARNILIAEGFLLKIGDFGMARCMASDARYQRLQSNEGSMMAVKWAALEVLEKEIYSFKSDIWSFATIIWEIATYGSQPFADFSIGASLEPFVQHLNDGNRPPQPDGLNDSIYEELSSCWSADPTSRPSASSLVDYFQVQRDHKELPGSDLGEQDDSDKAQ